MQKIKARSRLTLDPLKSRSMLELKGGLSISSCSRSSWDRLWGLRGEPPRAWQKMSFTGEDLNLRRSVTKDEKCEQRFPSKQILLVSEHNEHIKARTHYNEWNIYIIISVAFWIKLIENSVKWVYLALKHVLYNFTHCMKRLCVCDLLY